MQGRRFAEHCANSFKIEITGANESARLYCQRNENFHRSKTNRIIGKSVLKSSLWTFTRCCGNFLLLPEIVCCCARSRYKVRVSNGSTPVSLETQFRDSLFFQPRGSPSLELLFSCYFGYAAASVDALRRAEYSESSSALENRLFPEGAPSSGRTGRPTLRAADEADASQNEIRHYVQLYPIRGRSPVTR